MALVFMQDTGSLDGQKHMCMLQLYVDQSTGKYSYRFESNAFVFGTPDDTIEFELVNTIEGTSARILKHVSTPCEPRGASPPKVVVKTMNQSAVIADTELNPYRDGISRASYALNLEDHEMLHLGLIVEITPLDQPDKAVRLLCDPQVGNGPPKPLAGTAGTTSR